MTGTTTIAIIVIGVTATKTRIDDVWRGSEGAPRQNLFGV